MMLLLDECVLLRCSCNQTFCGNTCKFSENVGVCTFRNSNKLRNSNKTPVFTIF